MMTFHAVLKDNRSDILVERQRARRTRDLAVVGTCLRVPCRCHETESYRAYKGAAQNCEFDYPSHRKSEIKQPIAGVVLSVIGSPLRIDSRTRSRSCMDGAGRVLPNATYRSSIRPRYTIRGPLPPGLKTAASGVT